MLSIPESASMGVRRTGAVIACMLWAVGISGCSMRDIAVRNLADELASQGAAPEGDLDLAREAGAYHLKLSEAVLRNDPAHVPLATSVVAGFTQYTYAFVAFDADRLESKDSQGAHRLRERAARLYRRAMRHGLAAFELRRPGFRTALERADTAAALKFTPQEVGLAYWTAAAWGGMVSLSKDHPDVVADLPLAMRLATLAADADPAHGDGALASLMGSFEAGSPGQGRTRALIWFDRAIEQAAGRSVGAYVAKAEGHSLPAGDRDQFVSLLERALAVSEPEDSPLALSNEVMRRRARWLLEQLDELF